MLYTTTEVCNEGRLGSHWIGKYERPHWGWHCWKQIDKRELDLHKSVCGVSERRDRCCRHSLTELVWPEEVKKAAPVAGGTLGGEQRGGRKAGRGAEAWETVTYLLFLCYCLAPVAWILKCIYLISHSFCGWGVQAQISIVPQAQGVAEAAAVTEARLAEDFLPSWLTWFGKLFGLRIWVPVCLLALAQAKFSAMCASTHGSSKYLCSIFGSEIKKKKGKGVRRRTQEK